MHKDTEQWFVRLDSSEVVSMSLEELDLAFAMGRIHQDTFVLQVGQSRWQKLSDAAELGGIQTPDEPVAPALASATPLSPAPRQGALTLPAGSLAAARDTTVGLSGVGGPAHPGHAQGAAAQSPPPAALAPRAPQPATLGLGVTSSEELTDSARGSEERPKGGIRIPRPSQNEATRDTKPSRATADDANAAAVAAAAAVWRELAGTLPDAPAAPTGPAPAPLTAVSSEVLSLQERLESGAGVTITSSFPPPVQPRPESLARAGDEAPPMHDGDTDREAWGDGSRPPAPQGLAAGQGHATLPSNQQDIVDQTSSLIDEQSALLEQPAPGLRSDDLGALEAASEAASDDSGVTSAPLQHAAADTSRQNADDVATTSGAWALPDSVSHELGQLNLDGIEFRAGPRKGTLLLAAAAVLIVGGVVFAMTREPVPASQSAAVHDDPALEESTHSILPGEPAPNPIPPATSPTTDTEPSDAR